MDQNEIRIEERSYPGRPPPSNTTIIILYIVTNNTLPTNSFCNNVLCIV